MKIGSLCSGYGGLDLGVLHALGGTVAWHAETDPDASRVLDHHWPDVPNHGDIAAVDWAAVEPVDLVTAGFPCQDLSYAGRGGGIAEGTRSGLWYAVADALGVLRPRYVLVENVSAIVVRRPGLDVVLADLARLGFDAEWVCVRASDVGAPHRRERWFLLAGHADADGGAGRRMGGGPRAVQRSEVAARPAQQPGRLHSGSRGGSTVAAAHTGRDARAADDADVAAAADADGARRGEQPAGPPAQEARPHPGDQPGDHRGPRADTNWGPYHAAVRRWERTTGRPAPAPTVPGRHGRPRLSPALVEWMMGLPAGWVTAVPGLSHNAMLRILGNGVVPWQAAHAVRVLWPRLGEPA